MSYAYLALGVNYCNTDVAISAQTSVDSIPSDAIALETNDNDGCFGYNTIEDLSTGVAGFINFPFTYRNETQDANTALESGIYRIYGSAANAPTGNYGILITFNAAQYILQITADVGNSNAKIYIRTRNSNGVWSSWKEL